MIDLKSLYGYRFDSPYLSNPYLDIQTPEGIIDMSNTPFDLLGIDDLGNQQFMKAGRKKPYKFKGTTVREIPLMQTGGQRPPIYTNNPNDPRLRAYNDSLDIYNKTNNIYKNLKRDDNNTPIAVRYTSKMPKWVRGDNPGFGLWDGIEKNMFGRKENMPIGYAYQEDGDNNAGLVPLYKKPVQPVVYQKPQAMKAPPTGTNTYTRPNDNISKASLTLQKKRQPTYEDSMKLYNLSRKYNKEYGNSYPVSNLTKEQQDYYQNYMRNDKRKDKLKGSDISVGNDDLQGLIYHPSIKPTQTAGFYSDGKLSFQPLFKKPVGTPTPQEPKFKAPTRVPTDRPNIGNMEFNPNIPTPNMQRAEWDMNKPSNWSFTYPTGPYNEQKTMYFPDEKMWDSFIKDKRQISSQRTKEQGTATGYLQVGGAIPNAGSPYDLLSEYETAEYSLRNAKKLKLDKNGNFKGLVPLEDWSDDLMNYVDKIKFVTRNKERFVKVRGKLSLPAEFQQEPEGVKILQKGGYNAKAIYNYIFDDSDYEPMKEESPIQETFVPSSQSSELSTFQDQQLQEQSDFDAAMNILYQVMEEGTDFENYTGARGTGSNAGFRTYNTYEEGRAALEHQLELYKTGRTKNVVPSTKQRIGPSTTLLEAMSAYAPYGDGANNPVAYTNIIAKKTGVSPNTPISQIDTKTWANVIEEVEGNKTGNNPGNLRR